MPQIQDRPKVYRLQGLPDRPNFDRLAATQLVASVINDPTLRAEHVHICSLATTVEPHKRWNRKVATVMFRRTPSVLSTVNGAKSSVVSEWRFPVPGQVEPLVLDSHFLGLTVLNDVNEAEHRYDCIALSGLASHPFGSWQSKGDDKSYMWIRDTLPTDIDGVRFVLYGYDTTLLNSNSVQTIVDLANTLYQTLQTNGWESPSTKPLIFLAHSLGGVLLKQLFVLLAGGNDSTQFLLSMIKGAIFFGTPSRGMAVEQLLTMVGNQPNKDLIEHLSKTSDFLPNLETQFSGISHTQRMRLYWAYETKTSPTVEKIKGSYKRSGPRSIMVDRKSATGNRTLDSSTTIQIDEDHSDMVKFNSGDHRIPIIINKIRQMCCSSETHDSISTLSAMSIDSDDQYENDSSYTHNFLEDAHNSKLVGWDYEVIESSLRAPDRDHRFEQIDRSFGQTFSWAFENQSIGLSQWLREGEGIFWINGKPGSGKSTFIKFLLSDDRAKELLHHWRSKPGQIIAWFFFHHRGNYLQKSFEGLLGSLLSQLLEADTRLRGIVGELLDKKAFDLYKSVQSEVNTFFQHCKTNSNSSIHRKEMLTLLSKNPSLRLNSIIQEHTQLLSFSKGKTDDMALSDFLVIKETLLHNFDSLSQAARNKKAYAEVEHRICQNLAHQIPLNRTTIETIIRKWCESLNTFDEIQNFSKKVQVIVSSQDFNHYIGKLVNRQIARQKHQINLQLKQWTKSDLEDALRRIFDQDIFDLEICLFFDALDEYSGSHEVISAFLKDLIMKKSTSKTRTKILFSSRPWTIFRDHFGSCQSLSIQEHTLEDIHEYCAGSLPECSRTKALLRPFIKVIANRARGVFIWIKLVMADLVAVVTTTDEADEELSRKLRQCLDSLPDELDDYYSTIIHRLPASTIRQSYILLESLSKSSLKIPLHCLSSLLACGMSDSLHEAQGLVESDGAPGVKDPEGHVRTISGGMVDIVRWKEHQGINAKTDYTFEMQLMHQSVKDWIELPTFKHIILGKRAGMFAENGHSFLVKFNTYQLVAEREYTQISGSAILDHAIKAEMTTGVSQYTYLSQLPGTIRAQFFKQNPANANRIEQDHFVVGSFEPNMPRDTASDWSTSIASINDIDRLSSAYQSAKKLRNIELWNMDTVYRNDNASPFKIMKDPAEGSINRSINILVSLEDSISGLYLAASGGLSLYLEDSVQHDQSAFESSDEPLVSLLLEPIRYKSVVQHSNIVLGRLESIKLLLGNGYRLQLCPSDLQIIFEGIWRSPDQQTARIYTNLVLAAIQNGLPLTTQINIDFDPGSPTSLLHLSPPILAEHLLKAGADLNVVNSVQQSPLDYILDPESVFQRCPFGLDWLYGTLQVLVRNGARQLKGAAHSQRLQGQNLLQALDDIGYDTSPLQSLKLQSLTSDEEGLSLLGSTRVVSDVSDPPGTRNILASLFGGYGFFYRR